MTGIPSQVHISSGFPPPKVVLDKKGKVYLSP